jgi:hypothetical protein
VARLWAVVAVEGVGDLTGFRTPCCSGQGGDCTRRKLLGFQYFVDRAEGVAINADAHVGTLKERR